MQDSWPARLDLFGLGGLEQASSVCGFLTRTDAWWLGSERWCGERTEGITGAQAIGGDSSVYSAAAWSSCVV